MEEKEPANLRFDPRSTDSYGIELLVVDNGDGTYKVDYTRTKMYVHLVQLARVS